MPSLDEPGNPDNGKNGSHQNIYDFFPALVYVYDLDKKQLAYINKRITESLGYSYEEVQSWNQDLSKLIFRDDLELVQKELEKFNDLNEKDAHGYRCRLNHKEGDYVHFQVTGRVLRRNEKGRAESILFIAHNIHEQIQSAEQSRAYQELLDETENLLQFTTYSLDVSTNKETWSKGVLTLLNLDPSGDHSKITSEQFLSQVIPDDRSRIDLLYRRAIENKQALLSYEYTIETFDKKLKVLRSNIKFRYKDGKLAGVLGINRDVTEKSALINDLVGYRQMVIERETFLDQGNWEIDVVSGIMTWSDGMYTLFGYQSPQEKATLVINESIYKKHMLTEDYEKTIKRREDVLHGEDSYVWQFQITTNKGDVKQLETFGKVFRDVRGKALKVMGTTRDVTKMFKYERELERKIFELKRSNKDLEDFAYIASHDMHEPLRKVHSFADRLKTKYGGSLEEEGKGYLDRILAATQNARLMIDGLMEFSRLSRNGFWFEQVNLNSVVTEVLSDLELKIEETNARIDVQSLPEISAIRVQMKQLFSNVILNSIKFRRTDVVPIIVIKSEILSAKAIDNLNLDMNTEYIKLTVKDNGIGFEQEYSESVFQMFQRLNSKSEYPGSGIGLALCKKITDNHRGVISANSSPGQGTAITIILPVKHE